ncbi:MAG: hypothetical protein ACYTFK_13655 [Planctomycetota bacterium]|jgi:hypothetical protein
MSRRHGPPLYGARYCGNTRTEQVHDVDEEMEECLIEEIISSGRAVSFHSLEDAHELGYNLCEHCIGDAGD